MTVPGIIVDSYTWIEIFKNSPYGRQALALIEKNTLCAVSVLTLYELQYRLGELYEREKAASLITIILSHMEVIPVDRQVALMGGTIKSQQKKNNTGMGAVDCMILATARIYGLKILSGDRHFAGMDECLEISGT